MWSNDLNSDLVTSMVTSVVTNVYECYKARVQTLAVPPKFITDM